MWIYEAKMNYIQFEDSVLNIIKTGEITPEECWYLYSINSHLPFYSIFSIIAITAFDDTKILTIPEDFDYTFFKSLFPIWFQPLQSVNISTTALGNVIMTVPILEKRKGYEGLSKLNFYCNHEYKFYQGLKEQYEYCTKCDVKK